MLSVKIVFVSGFTLFFSFFMVGCSHQLYQLHADMLEWQDQFILWYSLRCTGTWSYFWLLPCFSLGVHCFVSPSRLQTGEHTTNQSHCFRINCDDANEQSKNDQKLQNSEKERGTIRFKVTIQASIQRGCNLMCRCSTVFNFIFNSLGIIHKEVHIQFLILSSSFSEPQK